MKRMNQTNSPNLRDWVRVGTAAKRIGVNDSTLRYAVLSGHVNSVMTGDDFLLVRIEDAKRWAESRKIKRRAVDAG